MSGDRHQALQDCLEATSAGRDLTAVLRQHPDMAADLRPALEAAAGLFALPRLPVPGDAQRRSRARLASAMNSERGREHAAASGGVRRLAPALAATALALLAGLGTLAAASAQALPGDSLYSLKRASETLHLRLTLPARARIELEDEYATRRADEVRRLLDLRRIEQVEFEGIVQGQSETSWLVTEIPVLVPQGLTGLERISTGMTVMISGRTGADGRFLAEAIRLVGFQYVAPVLEMSETMWTVGDYAFVVRPTTWVDPGIQVGEIVFVSLRFENTEDLSARAILRMVDQPLATSTAPAAAPTETPTVVSTVTSSPTALPSPGPAPRITPTSVGTAGQDGENEDLDEFEFEGIVESQSAASWMISGTVVQIDGDTEIEDDPQLGDLVKVKAFRQADGSLLALKIELDD